MPRKFEVTFSRATPLMPSTVYVSPDARYPGHFNVGVLHCTSKSGKFQPDSVRVSDYDLKQNLCPSEQEAIDWAQHWLESESGGKVTLKELSQ